MGVQTDELTGKASYEKPHLAADEETDEAIDEEREPRRFSPEHFVAYLTLAGLFLYGFSRISLSLFYLPLRTTPEEVGLSYGTTIASILGLLVTLSIAVVVVSLMLAILLPILFRFVLPFTALLLASLPIAFAAAIVVLFGLITLLEMLAHSCIVILCLTVLSLMGPDPRSLIRKEIIPIPRLVICCIGLVFLPFLIGDRLYYLGSLLLLLALLSEMLPHSSIREMLVQADLAFVRLPEVLRHMGLRPADGEEGEDSCVPGVPEELERSTHRRSHGPVLDLFYESPPSFAEYVKSRSTELKTSITTKSRARAARLATFFWQRLQDVHDMFWLLLRRVFLTLNAVLMGVVLLSLLFIPRATYNLGQAVADGRTYYALEPRGRDFWSLLLIPPFRAEPARLFWRDATPKPQQPSKAPTPLGGPVVPVANGQCTLYLGQSDGTTVIYLNDGANKGEAVRVPSSAVILQLGSATNKMCASKIAPKEWSIPISRWVHTWVHDVGDFFEKLDSQNP